MSQLTPVRPGTHATLEPLRPLVLPSPPPVRRRLGRPLAAMSLVVVALAGSTGLRLDPRAEASPARPRERAAAPATGRNGTGTRPSRPASAAAPRRLTLAFTGDLLIHERLWELAAEHARGDARFDFRPMLARLRPVIAGADLALCHLETPLSPDDAELASYPVFETPHELAPAIAWAGFDGCSTASNHSLDGGVEGVRATLRWLERAGLGHAGTARTREESRGVTLYDVDGVSIAHLSSSWGFNGFEPDEPWRANRIDVPALLRAARAARRAGADLVVVSLHWGAEYQGTPTAWQEEVAGALTRSRAIDLLVGHHAHVVQPIARVHGTWVAYGLGNILSGMTSSLGTEAVQDGVVLLARAERSGGRWSIEGLSVVTTRVEYGTWRVLPILRTLRRSHPSPALAAELRASDARTLEVLGAFGAEVDAVPGGRRRG